MNTKFLKVLRKEKGLRIDELVNITGLSRQTIARIERGGDAKLSSVAALCDALDQGLCIARKDQLE